MIADAKSLIFLTLANFSDVLLLSYLIVVDVDKY